MSTTGVETTNLLVAKAWVQGAMFCTSPLSKNHDLLADTLEILDDTIEEQTPEQVQDLFHFIFMMQGTNHPGRVALITEVYNRLV